MRVLVLIATFVVLSFNAYSQPLPTSGNGSKAADDVPVKSKFPPIKIGNVPVPPEKAYPITIPKIGQPLVIDGKPDEEIWKDAAVFKDFVQTGPGDNIAPSKPTEAYVMYDEKHLYVAFRCWDEKDKIRASVAKRDNVTGEDNVRFWLDTYNDQRRAYVFALNPFGIQQDGMYTEGQGADFSVDLVMESKGVIEDWGWSVEVKIPFSSLRYTAGKDVLWGFNAARNIDRFNDEFDAWLPDDRNVSGFLSKFGKITGLDGIVYERTLEVVPSVTISESGTRVRALEVASGRFVNQPVKGDIGVTLKYSLSPNVTLDAAINPDFAEIEADAPVITANQRFPIFFQEKRPFFLEGNEIFQTPLAIYHSRSIVDPDFASKLTGKIGKNSFGFMVASDKAPGNFDPDSRTKNAQCLERRSLDPSDPCGTPIDEFLDKNAFVGVFRLKRDFGKENHIGVFSTYRGVPEQKNFLVSVDSRLKLSPTLTSQIQVVGTHSRDCFFDRVFEPVIQIDQANRNRQVCGTGTYDTTLPISDPSLISQGNGTYDRYRTGNGFAYYANLDSYTDRHGWFAEVGGRTEDFRADVGFTRRTDTNFAFFMNRLATKSKPKAALIRADWRQFSGIDYDWQGRLQRWRFGNGLSLQLQRTMFAFFEAGISYEKLYEEEFGLKRMPSRLGRFSGDPTRGTWQQFYYAEVGQTLSKQIYYYFWLNYNHNTFDYFFPAGNGQINPGPGKGFDGEIFVEYKPINPLRASLSYRKSRLNRNDNSVRSFDSDIVSIRSTYQFTRFIFARARLDYDSLSSRYASQMLFGWTPSPGKAFYVGYNDNFNYNGFNPYTGQPEPGIARNSRTFFIRASYLFRKTL